MPTPLSDQLCDAISTAIQRVRAIFATEHSDAVVTAPVVAAQGAERREDIFFALF